MVESSNPNPAVAVVPCTADENVAVPVLPTAAPVHQQPTREELAMESEAQQHTHAPAESSSTQIVADIDVPCPENRNTETENEASQAAQHNGTDNSGFLREAADGENTPSQRLLELHHRDTSLMSEGDIMRYLEDVPHEVLMECLVQSCMTNDEVFAKVDAFAAADPGKTRIFIRGLNYETTRDSLAEALAHFGTVEDATVIYDKNTSRSKGYGFITFANAKQAQEACRQGTFEVDGRRTQISMATPLRSTDSFDKFEDRRHRDHRPSYHPRRRHDRRSRSRSRSRERDRERNERRYGGRDDRHYGGGGGGYRGPEAKRDYGREHAQHGRSRPPGAAAVGMPYYDYAAAYAAQQYAAAAAAAAAATAPQPYANPYAQHYAQPNYNPYAQPYSGK